MDQPMSTYPPAEQAAPPVAQRVGRKKRQPSGWGKLWAAFGLGVASYAIVTIIEVIALLRQGDTTTISNETMAIAEVLGGLVALLFIVALGGKNIARPSLKGMGTAWKAAIWLFVADGLFVVVEAFQVAMGFEEIEIAANWPSRVALLALLCFGIGLFEETTMRGLCLNGLLARMGRSRGGVYGAVILSSFFFGLLHFDPLVGFDDPLLVAQNCMKVLQSGMCGYLLAAILVNTRNIWAVALIHGANDFMLLFISNGLVDASVSTEYVQTGEDGVVILVLYIVLCTLYLPFIFIGRKLINQASPWRGDFYHYGEAQTAQPATTPVPYPANQPAMVYAAPPAGYPVATPAYTRVATTPAHARVAAAPMNQPAAPSFTNTPGAPASIDRPRRPRHAAPSTPWLTPEQRAARAALADIIPPIERKPDDQTL